VDTQDEFNPIYIDDKVTQNVIPQNKFIISYMGRFSEEKCPLKFVEIAEQLRNHEDLFFLMIGNGPEYESVKQKIANLGLENKIYIPGFVENNKPFLKATNLLIIPSRIEGIPIILMEALSLGVPVIASQIGGIPDIITNEVNGFVCNPNNIDDFVERIKQIYSDQNLYQKLKLNARSYAVENLDFRRMNREYLNSFLALMH
jgi:glycosyltransferase involved in cell wall biosynthesis